MAVDIGVGVAEGADVAVGVGEGLRVNVGSALEDRVCIGFGGTVGAGAKVADDRMGAWAAASISLDSRVLATAVEILSSSELCAVGPVHAARSATNIAKTMVSQFTVARGYQQ